MGRVTVPRGRLRSSLFDMEAIVSFQGKVVANVISACCTSTQMGVA